MKTIICFIITIILSIYTLFSQSFNHENNTKEASPILLGKINKEGLTQGSYNNWFTSNYEQYTPKQGSIDSLKAHLSEYTITLFMGTWCGDSKREVPRLYKILDSSNFSLDRLTTIAVDRSKEAYKQSPGGEHEGLNIHRVPSILFYKNGKEVNRIVESPKKTLEEDILAIFSKNYTPNYTSVIFMDNILSTKGASYVSKNAKKIVRQLHNQTENKYELNTYANVLFYAHKIEEAITVLSINTLLFSKDATTYINLADKYLYNKDTINAIKYYKKSLEYADTAEIQNKINELSMLPDLE
ncbi:hypothetical protein [Aquimarina longa]|uniref:hypothetical protein n=1 Tax=Aquimarina longa TaxID=1080221 RepID=UPI000A8D611F|nr:hypothetical protein [Aquimarina longa]